MPEVVYLTGAPAAGKSSLTHALKTLLPNLEVFEYGEQLTAYLRTSKGSDLDQANLRSQSSLVASPDDIRAVDDMLIKFVAQRRDKAPVIIDSHAVTKESYGYTVTAYSLRDFERLKPSQIWMLYTDPEIAVQRIKSDAQGRPSISVEQARFHTNLQSSVAINYAMHLGIPVYLFDSSAPVDQLATNLAGRISR